MTSEYFPFMGMIINLNSSSLLQTLTRCIRERVKEAEGEKKEREKKANGLSIVVLMRALFHHEDPILMILSQTNYFPKALTPGVITFWI